MAVLRDTPIEPLDVILFRGVDAVSRAICFMERKKLGRGASATRGPNSARTWPRR